MILFPLMVTWIWLQIFTASPLPALVHQSRLHVKEAGYDPVVFPLLQCE
jgi:hypothetical protein